MLADKIADHPDAVTRFVLVSRPGPPPPPTGDDLTSLAVYIAHDRVGALLAVLMELAVRGVNLTRIESRPTGEALGRYVFFLDCTGHVAEARLGEALQGLRRICADVRFLGSYPRHRWTAAAGDGRCRRRPACPTSTSPTRRPGWPGSAPASCLTRRRAPATRAARPRRRWSAEQAAEHAALLLLLRRAGDAARRLLRRLDDHEALAGEAHRERLTGAAAEQRAEAELVGPVVAGLQARRPADRRLRVDVGRAGRR